MTTKQGQVTSKPISEAGQRRLRLLLERRNAAQESVNEFVAYLQDEYAAADGWQITPDLSAFVPESNGEGD